MLFMRFFTPILPLVSLSVRKIAESLLFLRN